MPKTREQNREYERKWYSTPEGKAKRLAINNSRRLRQTEWLEELKVSMGGCKECGFMHPAALDFHHLDPNTKIDSLSRMVKDASRDKILAEVEKCIVLCANCHRIRHYQERIHKKLLNVLE